MEDLIQKLREILRRMDDDTLIESYGVLLKVLRDRKIIRTKNVVGDMGETRALNHYKKTSSLPDLQAEPIGQKNVDAINTQNERYSIKTTSNSTTGVFKDLNPKDSKLPQDKLFEYVIIVMFDENFSLKAIYQITWENFLILKKWSKRHQSWYLSVSDKLRGRSDILYEI
ncbi:hypothetical protein [Halobacillus kuroshimensis]|uniref:hypothetical protein n=1 Tax=Halobacillus kuroshimensis TaxID=302481 RepID=UPI000687E8D5|nr:hypothetical protein [Halobacillus kuroshimensis]